MKSLLVLGLFFDLLGVVLIAMGAVMQGGSVLRSLRERSKDSFDYDVQQRPWSARVLLRLGAKLGVAKSGAQREPPLYRAFPCMVYGFLWLIIGLLLQLFVALAGLIRLPQ
jgi:hypothetical protein